MESYIKHNTYFTFIYNGVQYRAKIRLSIIDKINNTFFKDDAFFDSIYVIIYKKVTYNKYISWLYDPKRVKINLHPYRKEKHYDSSYILNRIKKELDKDLQKRLQQQLILYKTEFGEIDQ